MSLVEGIGDEVLISFIIGFLLIVFLFGWATDFFRNFSFLNPNAGDDAQREIELADEIYRPSNRVASSSDNISENVGDVGEELDSNSSTPEPSIIENDASANENHVQRSTVETDISPNPVADVDNEEIDSLEPDSDDPESLRIKRLEFFAKKSSGDTSADGPSTSAGENVRQPKVETSQPQVNGHLPNREENDGNIPVNSTERAQGYFNIRLKSLDDSERIVRGKADQLIGAFKREYFAAEVASRKTVRLIYNGQVLQEQRTLHEYNIQEGTVVHVQISNINFNAPTNESQSDSELDLGQFFWPLLGVLLGVVWMLYFQYKEYFNASSTIALLGLSGLFLTIVWGQYARPPEQG